MNQLIFFVVVFFIVASEIFIKMKFIVCYLKYNIVFKVMFDLSIYDYLELNCIPPRNDHLTYKKYFI